MRCTPLAVWTSKLDDNNIKYQILKSEAEITHPNPVVHDVIFLYCKAIQILINNPEDQDRSVNVFKIIYQICTEEPCKSYKADPENEENIKSWLEIAAELSSKIDEHDDFNPLLDDPSMDCR